MSLIKTQKPDFLFTDERGTLTQIVHSGYEQVNSVFTKKGSVRGNWHFHENCTETFYVVSGEVRVSARLDGKEESKVFSSGDMFVIGRGIAHNFEYTEDTYLVVLYDRCVENPDGTKDIRNL